MFPRRYEHRRDGKKAVFWFVGYHTFLLNMPAKDNQETAKATPRAQPRKYVGKVSTMTLPSNQGRILALHVLPNAIQPKKINNNIFEKISEKFSRF